MYSIEYKMVLKIILLTIGLLGLIEGLLIISSPKMLQKMAKKFLKDIKKVKKAGIVEIIVSIVLILIAINI